MSQVLDAAEGEPTITAEKEDDTGVGSTERNVTSGKRFHVTTDAVSTAEKDVVNESDNNGKSLYTSGNLVTPEKDHEADSDGL